MQLVALEAVCRSNAKAVSSIVSGIDQGLARVGGCQYLFCCCAESRWFVRAVLGALLGSCVGLVKYGATRQCGAGMDFLLTVVLANV